MTDYEKPIITYIPFCLIEESGVIFEVMDLGLTINSQNWPNNLIYNPELIKSDEMFYESFCSDSTLYFYIESAIGRCKSLVSRAVHNPDIIWEHGPIRVLETGMDCEETWMTATKTEVAIKELKNEMV